MNTMEDKELQELFAAKRTVEANRRRQEMLRQLIEARATEEASPAPRKVRRLWPVWACAAAAAVALLLIMLPALFSQEDAAPLLVAETEVPDVRESVVTGISSPNSKPNLTNQARKARQTDQPSQPFQSPAAQPIAEEEPVIEPVIETPVTKEPIMEKPIKEEPVMEILETVAPTPHVMRRQSTLIACTEGCTVPEGTNEKSSRNVQINLFNNDNYADATIHTFVISK